MRFSERHIEGGIIVLAFALQAGCGTSVPPWEPGRVYTPSEAGRIVERNFGWGEQLDWREVFPDSGSRERGVQIFGYHEGPRVRAGIVLVRGRVIEINRGYVDGFVSVVVTDLDGDRHDDILLSFSAKTGNPSPYLVWISPDSRRTIEERFMISSPYDIRLQLDPEGAVAYATGFDDDAQSIVATADDRRLGVVRFVASDDGTETLKIAAD